MLAVVVVVQIVHQKVHYLELEALVVVEQVELVLVVMGQQDLQIQVVELVELEVYVHHLLLVFLQELMVVQV
tara:strand:- start:62 stop:277 length:216 start_codon:yes stop_codon:yes gene_type:complete